MLLRRHFRDPRRRIAAGQFSLVLGILISRFGPRLLFVEPGSFPAGFLDGLSLSFILLSLPLNLTGFMAMRREKRSG